MIRKKHDFDALVAAEMGLTRKEVRSITSAFLAKMLDSLADLDEVHLDGFGRLRVTTEKLRKTVKLRIGYPNRKNPPKRKGFTEVRVDRKFRVSFSKSVVLARMLRDRHGSNVTKEK